MNVKSWLPLEELKRLERLEKNAFQAKRLRIVILATEGWTAPALAMAVGLSRRVCQDWVARFNEEGLKGLQDQRGRAGRARLAIQHRQHPDDHVVSQRGRGQAADRGGAPQGPRGDDQGLRLVVPDYVR